MSSPIRRACSALSLTALAALALAGPAAATSATATLTAGSLAFATAVPNVTFSGTLSGLDQTFTSSQPIDVSDATGSGTGWDLTATSTTFTNGSHTLPTSATTINAAPSVACDNGATCLTATNSVSFPYTLPAATTAPTATKFFNAAALTGLGNQTLTPTWNLDVPADSYAGSYTSTWTISLVSGP